MHGQHARLVPNTHARARWVSTAHRVTMAQRYPHNPARTDLGATHDQAEANWVVRGMLPPSPDGTRLSATWLKRGNDATMGEPRRRSNRAVLRAGWGIFPGNGKRSRKSLDRGLQALAPGDRVALQHRITKTKREHRLAG